MTTVRMSAISFTNPYMFSIITFTSPMPIITYFESLLQPFDTFTWISIIIMLSTIIILLLLLNKASNIKYDLFWYIFVIVLRSNITKYKPTHINSLIILCWMLVSFILTTCYSMSIYSFISVPIEHRIESIDELIRGQISGKIQLVVERNSVYQYILVIIIK